MAREIILGRRNWIREPGVTFTSVFGTPALPIANLQTIRPQEVAEWAVGSNIQFQIDLGAVRRIGAFSFANLRTTKEATIRVKLTTNGTTIVYDTGVVSAWPMDTTSPGTDPWGVATATGTYNDELQEALGFPRIFIPNAIQTTGRYIDVYILSPGLLQVGVMGIWEIWEPPENFAINWSMDIVDESLLTNGGYGSTYIVERGIRRRLNFAFPAITEDEVMARELDYTLVMGKRRPVLAVPFPDAAGDYLEKTAVYGMISNNSQIANPFVGYYTQNFQVEQLI